MSNFNFILSNGQSLSIGAEGNPLTHDSVSWNDVHLFNGVGSNGAGYEYDILPADVGSLVGFVEGAKESHHWAMMNYLKLKGSLNGDTLVSPVGVGGKTIDELTSDSEPHQWGWGNAEVVLDASKAIAPIGDTYTIPFTTWIHGESNVVSYEGYGDKLRDYHNRLMAYSGETFPMFLDQTGNNSTAGVGTELLDYAINNNDAHLVVAKWWLNRAYNGDSVHLHLNANGYMLQGEYFGEFISKYLEGNVQTPLYPKTQTVSNFYKTVNVGFNLNNGRSLVIDETNVPSSPSLGLSLVYTPTHSKIIADSYMQSGNSITFEYDEPITTDAVFTIGNTLDDRGDTGGVLLPCINLRDDSNAVSPTQGIPLYNWCCQREWAPTRADGALDRRSENLWLYDEFDGSIAQGVRELGRSSDWTLESNSTFRVDYTSTIRSGQCDFWVGSTNMLIRNNESKTVIATVGTDKRLFLTGGTGGFDGTFQATVTKLTTQGTIYIGYGLQNSTDTEVYVNTAEEAKFLLGTLTGDLVIQSSVSVPPSDDVFWNPFNEGGVYSFTVNISESSFIMNLLLNEVEDMSQVVKTVKGSDLSGVHNFSDSGSPSYIKANSAGVLSVRFIRDDTFTSITTLADGTMYPIGIIIEVDVPNSPAIADVTFGITL